MNRKNSFIILILLILSGIVLYSLFSKVESPVDVGTIVSPAPTTSGANNQLATSSDSATSSNSLIYKNDQYRFSMTLPADFIGYKVIESAIPYGHSVIIRNPLWSNDNKYMDIPVLIYDVKTYNAWIANNFEGYPTAAPIGPTERGRNTNFVFATAPRYNFSYATGFEEVEKSILTLKGY